MIRSSGAPHISVVVTTYNRLDALQAVLSGFERVSYRDFELVVADDGSEHETGDWVRRFAARANYPVRHVWQEDLGFRAAAARNLAVRAARGSVFVFIDGDCVPYPDTLEEHAMQCTPGRAVAGGRCYLGQRETLEFLTISGLRRLEFSARARRSEGLRLSRLYWKNRFYRLTRLKARPKWHTANASVHRTDFEAINGFDERFIGWGYEDEDVARRLRRLGVELWDGCRRTVALHLFHQVHTSHRPSARGGEGHVYFKSGRFLTRPVDGLCRRRGADLEVELLGDEVPQELRALADKTTICPDVSVVFGESEDRPGRGEVTLRYDGPRTFVTLERFRRWLEERCRE